MAELTETQIEELRGLDAAATKAPWFAGGLQGEEHMQSVSIGWFDVSEKPDPCHYEDTIAEFWENGNLSESASDNAALIVAMRNALPALLDLATANLARGGEGETEELCKRLEAKAKILAQANYRNDEELEAIALIRRLVRERDEAKDRAALAEKYERAAKVAADAFDEDNARLNSHATTAEAQVERLRAENERLRVALEESDKQQVWQDGFDAARKMVESVTSRATWGPKATLHDAYQLGMDAVKGVFKRADLRRARTALEGNDGE